MASSTFPTPDPRGQSTGLVTDEELVARAQGGMPDAWAELVHRHHGAVFRAAHAALVSSADADDAAQEAWIAAWRALGEFRGQSSFRTWLLTIAWRKALDRRQGRRGLDADAADRAESTTTTAGPLELTVDWHRRGGRGRSIARRVRD